MFKQDSWQNENYKIETDKTFTRTTQKARGPINLK